MIVVHGETLWSPAPQPMDDDDDDDALFCCDGSHITNIIDKHNVQNVCVSYYFSMCHVPQKSLFLSEALYIYVTRHNKTGQLSITKKNVIFLLSERAFY